MNEGFGTRVLGIEVSTEPGVAHFIANDVENRTLAVMREWLADARATEDRPRPQALQPCCAR